MGTEDSPLVSVIIATYHRIDSLQKALESVVKQTYKQIEAIVIDDNADKDWNGKVESVINLTRKNNPDFPFLFIINEINKGSAETRNIGIRAARGEYITFLDDDDVYLPEKIEKQLYDMVKTSADYGITDLNLYDNNDKLVDRRTRSYINATDPTSLLRYHFKYHMTGTDTLMFRAEYLKKIDMFPPIDVGDEFFLMERAIAYGGKLCYSPHCYVKAYIHEGDEEGLSSGEQKIQGENALYELKKQHFSELPKRDIRYIKVRHYMVIAFAQLRRRCWGAVIKHGVIAALISPIVVFKILRRRA